jgi:hypothetical protein
MPHCVRPRASTKRVPSICLISSTMALLFLRTSYLWGGGRWRGGSVGCDGAGLHRVSGAVWCCVVLMGARARGLVLVLDLG